MELGTYLLAGGFLIIFAPLAIVLSMLLKQDSKVIEEIESGAGSYRESNPVHEESGLTNQQRMYVDAMLTMDAKLKPGFTV